MATEPMPPENVNTGIGSPLVTMRPKWSFKNNKEGEIERPTYVGLLNSEDVRR
jgi:hypothetical protein